jgi:hypothetical protein
MFVKFNVVWGTGFGGAAGWRWWCWRMVTPSVVVMMVLVHISQCGLNMRYELRHFFTAKHSKRMAQNSVCHRNSEGKGCRNRFSKSLQVTDRQ